MKVFVQDGMIVMEDAEQLTPKQVSLCKTFASRVEGAAKDLCMNHSITKEGISTATRVVGETAYNLQRDMDSLKKSHMRLVSFIDSLERDLDDDKAQNDEKDAEAQNNKQEAHESDKEVLEKELPSVDLIVPIPVLMLAGQVIRDILDHVAEELMKKENEQN